MRSDKKVKSEQKASRLDMVSQVVALNNMQGTVSVRGHLSISLPYLLYSLLSPPTISTPTPLCAYVYIIIKGRRPLSPIVDDFAY
jgi:hypothetical protein